MSKGKDKHKKKRSRGVFNELLGMFKTKKSRKISRDGDEGLPKSPGSDLMENGLRGSKDSLGFSSMDEAEIEEEFFSNKWSVSKHKSASSPVLRSKQSKQKIDLNAVSHTKALSNDAAKHKLAIKQVKRPASQFRNRRPRSPAVPRSPLANVTEDVRAADESPVVSDVEDRAQTPDRRSTDVEDFSKIQTLHPPPKTSHRAPTPEPVVEVHDVKEVEPEVHEVKPEIREVKPDIHKVKPDILEVKPDIHEVKPDIHEVKVEDNKENVEPEVEVKEEPKEEIKPEPKHEEPKKPEPKHEEPKKEEPPPKQEVEPKKETPKQDDEAPRNAFGGVMLRRTGKLQNIGDHGTLRADKVKEQAKRQTIAGDSAVSAVFPGSKVATQRSSVHEPKDWEKLEAKTKKEPVEAVEADGANEFSQVFSKLKKRNSTNITALVEADQKSPDHSPVKESKPFVPETKPSVVRDTKPIVNRDAKPTLKEQPKVETPEPKRPELKPEPEPKRPELKAEPEPKRPEPKTELKAEEPKTERPRSISPGATDSNKKTDKPVVVVSEQPKDLGKDKVEPFKRDSPILKDRERSKTIGTPPMSQKNETKSSPIVKRTLSQKFTPTTTPTSNPPSQQQPEPEKRPVLKPAPKFEPKKPEEPAGNTGGQPAWIAMARRKTGGWDENRDPEKELKEASNKAKKEDDDENRKSKVMDLMKNFQNS